MIIKYANRAKTQLARSISANEGIISVISGQGSLFPSLTQGAQLFPLTLVSIADQSQFEICYVLARNADSMTVLRGQEGTTAQAFESGDIVSLNMTASVFGLFPQAGYLGVYDPDIARTIGGYKKNAVLADGNIAGTLWLSLQDNNKTPPSHEATSWWLKLDFVSLGTQLGSFVSGLLGMRPQDKQGISLFTNGDNGLPVYSDVAGHKIDLAPQSTLDKVNKDLQGLKNHAVISDAWSSDDTSISSIRIMHNQPHNRVGVVSADGKHDLILPNIDNLTDLNNDLQSFKADAVTGHGYSDGDQRVTNIWANNDKEYPRLQANIGTNQTLITARIEDITKETTRAQSAEATLVSGHYGIRPGASPARAILLSENGNISVCALVNDADQWVELLSTPNAASTYQLRGDYATNPALDDAVANVVKSHAYASTDAVISAIRVWMTGDNGNPMLVAQTKDSDDFRCASVESVRNETTRATSAEATLVSGHYGIRPGASPARAILLSENGNISVCALVNDADQWVELLSTPNAASTYQLRGDYATNPALDDAVANVVKSHAYASTDAVISAIRVWMTGDNGNPMLVAQTKDSDDFRCASVESVRNETTRATSAEATLVSGHYGVGTGSSPVRSAIGNDKGGLSVCFDKSGDVWEAFLTENSVRETTLGITGRYSMQRFSATIKDNQWVSVPTPFSDDDVVYIVSPLISKNFINWVGVNFDATTPKNKNGFTARIYSGRGDGGVIHWSPFTLVFDVIAIGKM